MTGDDYSETFGAGSHFQGLGKPTTSHVNLGIAEPEHGGLKVTLMRNGSLLVLVRSYGFMENVGILLLRFPPTTAAAAGAGKSVIWYYNLSQ